MDITPVLTDAVQGQLERLRMHYLDTFHASWSAEQRKGYEAVRSYRLVEVYGGLTSDDGTDGIVLMVCSMNEHGAISGGLRSRPRYRVIALRWRDGDMLFETCHARMPAGLGL